MCKKKWRGCHTYREELGKTTWEGVSNSNGPLWGYLDKLARAHAFMGQAYIGQASVPKFQISAYHKNIQGGHQDSLSYWTITKGEQRVANLIRLWTIPFSSNVLGLVKEVFENFLEIVMCRAFHSLPPSTLEELFVPSRWWR